ncbi:unnamed protein product [Rotaria sordida]|uniref:RING-type domain-containing protein n=1 Tax=Rotaria sordida TaxID=392033 RepID=A0A814NU09_9BILA|nr:unnamed protein product [Rotaria sordida]CAF3521489.1 unnamed protein product [Rotaria sordida]
MSTLFRAPTDVLSDPPHKWESMDASSKWCVKKKEDSPTFASIRHRIQSLAQLTKRLGVYTVGHMSAAGFEYTGNGDTARCKDCGLEVSNWRSDMNPFTIHSKQRPDCPFVYNIIPSSLSNEQTNPSERQSIEAMDSESVSNTLLETSLLQQVRRRTFSHWPHPTIPSSAQMMEAGFFNCNVGDRVICIYCNLICQQWTPNTDDPCEVHKTLSSNCIYVKAKLICPSVSSLIIVNEGATDASGDNRLSTSHNLGPLRSNDIKFTASCNPAYSEIPKRHASFATWPTEDLPSVDDLVRAGFFYTGTKTIVTCFYCNGSLQNWGPNDNPMIEHARWFPHCAYARQLCGDDLYRKIQESKRAQQGHVRANELKERTGSDEVVTTNPTSNSRLLSIPDESTLSTFVAARLDLPISQRLLDQNFKLPIIKRCWEDQLRIKHDDFVSECDLYIACLILQKQIEHIDGKKENIVIPSIKMKQIREQNARIHEQSTTTSNTAQSVANSTDVEITTSSNPCVLCLTEEKRLACIPCGHMATCVACGHSLRSCPICRREIEAFVRIYI